MLNFLIGLYAVPEPSIFRCPKKVRNSTATRNVGAFSTFIDCNVNSLQHIFRLSFTAIIIIHECYSSQWEWEKSIIRLIEL